MHWKKYFSGLTAEAARSLNPDATPVGDAGGHDGSEAVYQAQKVT
jgi:hypothetical protein